MESFDIRWYSVVNVAAGIWLLFAHILSITDVPVMSGWAAYVLGSYIAAVSAMTLQVHDTRLHGINIALGLAAVLSPFIFGFSAHSTILQQFIGVGLVVAGTSAWAAVTGGDEEEDSARQTA